MKPAPLTPPPEMHHLPRLAPEFYRGFVVVQWTLTLERCATGWLDETFHRHFRELLLHAAVREGLFCPVYVLMPDHLRLLWMSLRADSDQRNAMKFLRKHLAAELARRSPGDVEFELQKQAHDSVLREKDRRRGALEKSCFYILDNPCRKKLVNHPARLAASGCGCAGLSVSASAGRRFRGIVPENLHGETGGDAVAAHRCSGVPAERRIIESMSAAVCRRAATKTGWRRSAETPLRCNHERRIF